MGGLGLGDGTNTMTDSDLDETLRSIESGNFDIDDFLPSLDEDGDDLLLGLDLDEGVGNEEGMGERERRRVGRPSKSLSNAAMSAGRGGKVGVKGKGKGQKAAGTPQRSPGRPPSPIRRPGAVDDDEEEETLEEEADILLDDEAIALELGEGKEGDLMLDVSNSILYSIYMLTSLNHVCVLGLRLCNYSDTNH